MSKIKLTLGLVLLGVVIWVGVSYPKSVETVRNVVGSVVGPDVFSPYFSINGQRTEYRSCTLTPATTTPCSIAIPTGTSTLMYYIVNITKAPSGAFNADIGTSTTAYSTTTVPLVFRSGAANPFPATPMAFAWTGASSSPAFGTLQSHDVSGLPLNFVVGTSSTPGGLGSYLVFKIGTLPAVTASGTIQAAFKMLQP